MYTYICSHIYLLWVLCLIMNYGAPEGPDSLMINVLLSVNLA